MKWFYLFALVVTLMLMAIVASAHEWYPDECCHERDCFHIRDGGVQRVDGGWFIVDSGEFISDERTQETPGGIGGGFHRCTTNADPNGMTFRNNVARYPRLLSKPACFWAPRPDG